ncbi:hypothetical protein BX600DRAFT_434590 [Xylariales sp. PMI_506]|nr:hypothetical protein BX600DRAFT_434590 [Xylariales sp. PMI_506]
MSESTAKPTNLDCPCPGGYPQLAKFMGYNPQLSILRRFTGLSVENLLYYQAEIAVLEKRLRIIQAEDRTSGDPDRKLFGQSWQALSSSATSDEAGQRHRAQFDLVMRLRELTNQYQQAVISHNQMLALRRPHRKLVDDLRCWMNNFLLGRIEIYSCDWKTWDPYTGMEEDLFTFENSIMDQFTTIITFYIIDGYHKLLGRHSPSW